MARMKCAASFQRTTLPFLVVRKSSLLATVAKHVLATVIPTCILIVAVFPAFGQMNTAEISGLVEDPSGATVANAAVEVVEASTQLKYTTVSNGSRAVCSDLVFRNRHKCVVSP